MLLLRMVLVLKLWLESGVLLLNLRKVQLVLLLLCLVVLPLLL